MIAKLVAYTRKALEMVEGGPRGVEGMPLHVNQHGDLYCAQGAARYEDIVAAGHAFEINSGMTTALDIAAVIAVPTTAVIAAIYNGEADGGKSLVIDQAWALMTTAGAAVKQASLLGCLGTVRETAPTDATPTGALRALNGMGGKDTKARWIVSGTALPATTGIAANWTTLATGVNTAIASLPGSAIMADIDGRIIVPPGRYFGLHVLCADVTAEWNVGLRWHERQLALGG